MEYSGRTTAYSHKFNDWTKKKCDGDSAIQQVTLFDVQWSDCPVEVEAEVKKLWRDAEYGNDHFYYKWDVSDEGEPELIEAYPIIHEYLKSKGVTKCLIHWWW